MIDRFFKGVSREWFELLAFVVMPNHYHLVIVLGRLLPLSEVVGNINENTSRLIKRGMKPPIDFWQDGYHDHFIRPTEDIRRYIEYTHMNPVEEGLVTQPEEWPFSSASPEYAERLKRMNQEQKNKINGRRSPP
ncbi:MAG: REP-associated tyrosine transposase [Planctomycetota bacterium]